MDTLLLSSTYEPVGPVPWQRAMTLWAAGRVEVLAEHADRVVSTVDRRFAMPSVIRYVRGRLRRRRGLHFTREGVFARDGGECQYCGVALTRAQSTYDHVTPRRLGGATCWENIVLSCFRCNQKKGGAPLHETNMTLRRPPRRPLFLPATWLDPSHSSHLPPDWVPYLPRLVNDP